jgi:DNA topoisomerase-1
MSAVAPDSEREAKSAVMETIAAVARELGNTAAVCRKSYIHPAVLGAHQDPVLFAVWSTCADGTPKAGLTAAESALLRFLEAAARQEAMTSG